MKKVLTLPVPEGRDYIGTGAIVAKGEADPLGNSYLLLYQLSIGKSTKPLAANDLEGCFLDESPLRNAESGQINDREKHQK